METKNQTGVAGKVKVNNGPAYYDEIVARINRRFVAASTMGPFFRTKAQSLYEAYLAFMPAEWAQHHRCHCCRHFFEQYGDLAYVTLDGQLRSALWHEEDAEGIYLDSFKQLRKSVERSEISGVFLTDQSGLGTPLTGIWTHFNVVVPEAQRYKPGLLTASQRETELNQDYALVKRTLGEFNLGVLETAVRILSSDLVDRNEKIAGPVKWFALLQRKLAGVKNGQARNNLVWQAVASAPTGFAHLRNSVTGGILDDLLTGKTLEQIVQSVNRKTDSRVYQRPTEAPTEGAIKVAEEAFAKLGLAPALGRRYAKLEEVEAFWKPSAPEEQPASGKLFGHLKTKGASPAASNIVLPTETMTWVKFADTVLPTASTIELKTPAYRGNYFGLLTAADPTAPPIIQWDSKDDRNPFSWYVYQDGSFYYNWNLEAEAWVPVTAITDLPCRWNGKVNTNFGNGRMFVLSGARDKNPPSAGLFMEVVRSDLRHVRSVIEAYSKSATPEGRMEATACGLLMIGTNWGHTLRVNGDRTYRIDRWD